MAAYKYQQDSCYFVQIAEGLKEAGAEELAELGAEDIASEFSGIYFRADKSTLYRINYLTRLASRCLAPLISFNCHDTDALYREAKQIQWEDFFEKAVHLPCLEMFPTAIFLIQSTLLSASKMLLLIISRKKPVSVLMCL